MNKQKIKEALDLLNAAIEADADDELITLNVQLSEQDLDVLRDICKVTISVPEAVVDYYPSVNKLVVKRVLKTIGAAIDRIRP